MYFVIYSKVQRVFSVSPLMAVAMANINVANPMLAWTGIIALRHPYVAFSQHKHTKNLQQPKQLEYNLNISTRKRQQCLVSTHVKKPNTNCNANNPIVTRPNHECNV